MAYLAVVVGLALILLTIAFRSILVPLTAIGGFLLTIIASFGAVVLVFQKGVLADVIGVAQTGPLISLLPVLIIGVIFGLAMDYQVFLVSRMHEAFAHGASPHDAVRDGFRNSARVVTAAALIMISVFSGFILPDDPIIKSIGPGSRPDASAAVRPFRSSDVRRRDARNQAKGAAGWSVRPTDAATLRCMEPGRRPVSRRTSLGRCWSA
jgi:uncharacterized membrane protein YdfJ with MMPL/SSD domain